MPGMEAIQHTLGTWIAAILTLMIFSFLYKDNPFYKVAESLFAGVSIGYAFGLGYQSTFLPEVYLPVKNFIFKVREGSAIGTSDVASLHVLIPALIGLCTLFPFIYPKLAWLTTLPFALVIGYGAGFNIPNTIGPSILDQMEGTVKPFYLAVSGNNHDPMFLLWSILVLIGIFATLSYFFFSAEHKGALKYASRLGIYFVMVGFGAAFGLTVMARVSLVISRFEFLMKTIRIIQ